MPSGIAGFFKPVTAEAAERQRLRQAETHRAAHAAEQQQREAAPPREKQKPGPKPKPKDLSQPPAKKTRQEGPSQPKTGNPNRRRAKSNWWHPIVHTEIVEAVRWSRSFSGAVKALRNKNQKLYGRLEQRTVAAWFEKRNKRSPSAAFVLTAGAILKGKAGFPTRNTKGTARSQLAGLVAFLTAS